MYSIGYFKGFLIGVLIILTVFIIIGVIRLQIDCYSTDKIINMPGYCALVL